MPSRLKGIIEAVSALAGAFAILWVFFWSIERYGDAAVALHVGVILGAGVREHYVQKMNERQRRRVEDMHLQVFIPDALQFALREYSEVRGLSEAAVVRELMGRFFTGDLQTKWTPAEQLAEHDEAARVILQRRRCEREESLKNANRERARAAKWLEEEERRAGLRP